MKSIMTSVKINTNNAISLRNIADAHKLAYPISINDLIDNVLRPPIHEWNDTVINGDVSCKYRFVIAKNGIWSFEVEVHDAGIVDGDTYEIEAYFKDHFHIGTTLEGNLEHSKTVPGNKAGQDFWIMDNWDKAISIVDPEIRTIV